MYTLLTVDPIEMEFGYSLIPMVDENSGGKLINFRHFLVLRQNPPGGDAVGRLHGLDAVDLPGG